MIKIPRGWVVAGVISSAVIGISGCQVLSGSQTTGQASNQAWANDITLKPIAGEVTLACLGTYHCEFTQVDKTLIINADTHTPMRNIETPVSNNAALSPLDNKQMVKTTLAGVSGMPMLNNYYVRMLPKKREVHVNFYPEPNTDYTERFAMIHEFTDSGIYQLKAYRKRSSGSGSLLDTASPDPLCVDLLHNQQVLRHFCKAMNPEHQGEFIETRVPLA